MKKFRIKTRHVVGLVLLVFGLQIIYEGAFNQVRWYNADRSSMGIAPKPEEEKEPVVLVFAARTYGWRGNFGVHSWIATKDRNAKEYNIYQVARWYLRRGGSTVQITQDIPDRKWFGNDAILIEKLVGAEAESAIVKIKKAVKDYPYADRYVLWPGPNSNTFISYIIRQVPELKVELPSNAIGKDYLGKTTFISASESGTGVQFSLWGLLGVIVGYNEGIEINLLGLSLGLDLFRPAIKLPFVGRIGLKDKGL